MPELHATYVSRHELRRMVFARLGVQTSGNAADQLTQTVNEKIRAAAHKVFRRCHWLHTKQEHDFTLETDQRVLNYPPGCGPGSIVELALWDDPPGAFRPLERRRLALANDLTPLQEEGGERYENRLGRPLAWEPREQIVLWPPTDQEYRGRLHFSYYPDLAYDEATTVVDGEAVVLYALAGVHKLWGEHDRAAEYEAEAADQVATLMAAQATREAIELRADLPYRPGRTDAEARLDRSVVQPRWDAQPFLR